MTDFEKLREQKTVIIFSQRIAEKLVFRYGLRNLIGMEPSRKNPRQKTYMFYNFPELVDEFQQMVEELAQINNERFKAEQEYYNILESAGQEEIEIIELVKAVKSVDDADVLDEDDGNPKSKRGRKKKVDKSGDEKYE